MTAITDRIADFVAGLSYEALPQEVVARANLLVMDMVGIALRARYDAESTASLLAAVRTLGLGDGNATVIGDDAGYAPPAAALINGTLAHSLDFDDTHAKGSIHAGAPVIPAALAAAEMVGANGRDVLAAVIAGFEVEIRLSLALGPSEHYARGYHPTATCGVFGAAAAASRLFGLSAGQTADSFGICVSQAAGSMQFLAGGAWTKRFQVGHAAMCGLMAAGLAREGFRGAAEPFEGKAGFLSAYAPNPSPELAVDGLGERYETLAIAVKPYPSCRYSHAGLDALIDMREAHDLLPEEIEDVEIGLTFTGRELVGEPEDAKQRPENVVDGQFSMPFLGAVVLRQGSMSWDDYARHLRDERTLALCRKIRTAVEPDAETAFASPMSARARVRTRRGTFERFVPTPKGEPENFPTAAELRTKFNGLAAPYLPAGRLDAFGSALASLEDARDVGALLRLSRRQPEMALSAAAGDG